MKTDEGWIRGRKCRKSKDDTVWKTEITFRCRVCGDTSKEEADLCYPEAYIGLKP